MPATRRGSTKFSTVVGVYTAVVYVTYTVYSCSGFVYMYRPELSSVCTAVHTHDQHCTAVERLEVALGLPAAAGWSWSCRVCT